MIGSISSYAKTNNEFNPLKIKINTNVLNNRDIIFEGILWCKGLTDTIRQQIIVSVENATEISGVLVGNNIWDSSKTYLITGNTLVESNSSLTILPGTKVFSKTNSHFVCDGIFNAIGTKESPIYFGGDGGQNWNGFKFSNNWNFEYCLFENAQGFYDGYRFLFYGGNGKIKNSQFSEIDVSKLIYAPVIFCDNLIINSTFYWAINSNIANGSFHRNVIVNNQSRSLSVHEPFLMSLTSDTANVVMSNKPYNASPGGTMEISPWYFGTTVKETLLKGILDFSKDPFRGGVIMGNQLNSPPSFLRGIVWKILVNGKDAQDEVVDPVGVGPQRYDVYFNRAMDTTYVPQLTFGVREPYTQQAVVDSSSWSADRKIWAAYKTIKLYTGDGINRLRVEGARDDEGFEIPVEDQRFEFLISAAGSSSLDFAATAGLGKVNLEWSNPQDVPDLLGYNMYRLEHINDSTLTQPVMINTSLINDTLFTDYDVTPNRKYYYYYRTVRTDFSESDSSRVVSTTPYTAALGDGNGDLSVNVLDVLGTVSYILGQNPQPFIFDAADVVRDSIINVLDVVGNVNIILKGTLLKNYLAKTSYGNAKIEFTGNEVYLTTDQPIAGIQLQFKGKGLKDKKFIYSGSAAFENMSSSIGDTTQIALMYSLSKNEFAPGKYLIVRIEGDAKGISLSDAVLSDNEGGKINLNLIDNGISTIPDNYYLDQNYPNPFNLSTTIQYGIPAKTAGKIVIYNILGQQVRTFDLGEREAGRYKIMWDGKNNYGNVISTGVYIFRFESVKFTSAKKMMLLK